MKEKSYDIEIRLIEFSVQVVVFIEGIPQSKAAIYLGSQLLRSGISPALNYGEAKAAESKNDFIHKMKVCLKELRETYNCLRIIHLAKIFDIEKQVLDLISECNELISIFVKSINTASKSQRLLNK